MKNLDLTVTSVYVAVDVVVFSLQDNLLKVLLINRTEDTFHNQLALPGGFLRQNETSLEAARRLLRDKAGVGDVFMEQLYTFDQPARDPRGRVISIAYYALVPGHQLQLGQSVGGHTPALYTLAEAKKLAFDHDAILTYAARRLQSKLAYTNIAYSLLPDQFSFTQLQRLYEIILGRPLDKRNFRKKYLSLGLIQPTDQKSTGARHRPAQLYRFISASPQELSEPAL